MQIEHLWQTTFAHGAFPETRVKKYGGKDYKVRIAPHSFSFPWSMLGAAYALALALYISGAAHLCVRSLKGTRKRYCVM